MCVRAGPSRGDWGGGTGVRAHGLRVACPASRLETDAARALSAACAALLAPAHPYPAPLPPQPQPSPAPAPLALHAHGLPCPGPLLAPVAGQPAHSSPSPRASLPGAARPPGTCPYPCCPKNRAAVGGPTAQGSAGHVPPWGACRVQGGGRGWWGGAGGMLGVLRKAGISAKHYGTGGSRVIPQPSTNPAQRSLTSEF